VLELNIPNWGNLEIENLLLDYNGTIALDGRLKEEIKPLILTLSKTLKIYVITADTFGSVKEELKDLPVEILILNSLNHTKEKRDFLNKLGSNSTIAIGNGNNDSLMLKDSIVSIAILGEEGCSMEAINSANILSPSIKYALELLINTKRLIATLRR